MTSTTERGPTLIIPDSAGEGTGIVRYAERLSQAIEPNGGTVIEHPCKEISIFGKHVGGYISRWAWLLFSKIPGDVVHALNIFQLHRDANILTVHDMEVWTHPSEYGLGARVWRWLSRRLGTLDAIITPSHHVRRQVMDAFHVTDDRVHVIHHGVDASAWFPDYDRKLREDGINILTVGDVRPRKGTHKILQAMELMDGVHWHHAGPEDRSRGYARTVRGRWKRLERQGCLTDHGYLTDDELRQLYSSVDLLVYPSREEGFGFPPIEAARCGTPSLLTPLPVFKETLGDEAFYLDTTTPTPEAIAAQIQGIGNDRVWTMKAARRKVRPLTWEQASKRTLTVYDEVMA